MPKYRYLTPAQVGNLIGLDPKAVIQKMDAGVIPCDLILYTDTGKKQRRVKEVTFAAWLKEKQFEARKVTGYVD